MEPVALLPTDVAALFEPLARGAARPPRSAAIADGAAPGADAFAQFLALLTPPLPGGQALPVDGKPLPLGLPLAEAPVVDVLHEVAAPPPTAAPLAAPGAAPASTVAGLAVWLALQAEPAGTGTAPSATAADLLETTPPGAARAGSRLSAVSLAPLPAPLPAASGPPPPVGASGGESAAVLAPAVEGDALPFDAARQAPTAAGATPDVPVLDDLPPSERPLELLRSRAEARPVVPPPTQPAGSAPPAAAWLAPAGEAAVQAAARAAEPGSALVRGSRRAEPLVVAHPAALADTAAPPMGDWLPPAAALGSPTPSAAAAATSAPAAVPQPPVDTRAPQWHEAFASRIQWLVDQRVGEARIKLNPPELGAVDVKISLVEDKTYVQLTAATAAARDELTQGLPRLRDLFVASGLELGGASVQGGRGGHSGVGAGGYEAALRQPSALPDLDAPRPADAPRASRRGVGAIDVFA